jgi:hypothetical protein
MRVNRRDAKVTTVFQNASTPTAQGQGSPLITRMQFFGDWRMQFLVATGVGDVFGAGLLTAPAYNKEYLLYGGSGRLRRRGIRADLFGLQRQNHVGTNGISTISACPS